MKSFTSEATTHPEMPQSPSSPPRPSAVVPRVDARRRDVQEPEHGNLGREPLEAVARRASAGTSRARPTSALAGQDARPGRARPRRRRGRPRARPSRAHGRSGSTPGDRGSRAPRSCRPRAWRPRARPRARRTTARPRADRRRRAIVATRQTGTSRNARLRVSRSSVTPSPSCRPGARRAATASGSSTAGSRASRASSTSAFDQRGRGPVRALAVEQVVAELEGLTERPTEPRERRALRPRSPRRARRRSRGDPPRCSRRP